MIVFEHTYKKQIWYCVPNPFSYAFYFSMYNVLSDFGRKGTDWRFKIIKPRKSIITFLRLSDVKVPYYNEVVCFMFIDENKAKIFSKLVKEKYEEI